MIERHITFNVHADKTDAFERFFDADYRPAMTSSPGFVRAELLREADSPTRYQMILRFADGDSAVGWRTSAVHQALQPQLTALFSDNEIATYEVIA
jgi:antibiotic biosynthesis monooxygenase (ABM) superfamily enzyme